MSEKLLPCPFCGADAQMEQLENDRWSVGCASGTEPLCMGYQSLTSFDRRGNAVKAWNTRVHALPRDHLRDQIIAIVRHAEQESCAVSAERAADKILALVAPSRTPALAGDSK